MPARDAAQPGSHVPGAPLAPAPTAATATEAATEIAAVAASSAAAAGTMPRWLVYAAMTLHVSCAAGTYVIGKPAANAFPGTFTDAGALTLARGVIASVLCLALTGWAIPAPRFTRRQWVEIAGLSALLVVNQILFLYGLHWTAPSHPALIYALTPAGVMLLIAAIERRRPPAAWLVGVPLAIAGVVLVLEPWNKADALVGVRRGDIAIFAGLLVWVVYTVWVKRLTRTSDPRTVTVWTLVLGTVMLAPFSAGTLAAVDFAAFGPRVWAGLFWFGAITSTLMMLLWNGMLKRLQPVEVSICANAQPVATAALAAALSTAGYLQEEQHLGPAYWAGTALVVAGVLLVQWRRR